MAVSIAPLAPARAIAAVEAQSVGGRFSFDWRDTFQQENATAFVVAKAMKREILTEIHGALRTALAEGQTLDQFRRTLTPRLQALGWWGRQSQTDPLTGETRVVQLGSPRRLKTIFDANLRTAHAAGRWERFERQKEQRPYLRYVAVQDERTRAQHRAWHDTILPVDHPFWRTHAPPNGWNCRCMLVSVSESDLMRNGWSVTGEDKLKAAGFGKATPWLNKRTGETTPLPDGIDPGWAFNPGAARAPALTPAPDDGAPGTAPPATASPQIRQSPMPRPRRAPAERILPDGISDQGAIAAFLREFPEPVFFPRTLSPLAITERLFRRDDGATKLPDGVRREHILLLADTIRKPDEIWAELVATPEGSRIKLRFLARWTIEGAAGAGLAVFEEDGAVWRGATAFPPNDGRGAESQERYLRNRARRGQLIWRRLE